VHVFVDLVVVERAKSNFSFASLSLASSERMLESSLDAAA